MTMSESPAVASASNPRLTTRGVVLERRQQPIARFPDLSLGGGETVALMGASGTGKSTALLALAGIHPPAKGVIAVDGVDPWTLSSARRDRWRGGHVGLVFQNFHLVDAVSVAENLALAATCAGLTRDSAPVASLLVALGIADLARRPADSLSHGQAQRVAVARALVNRPGLILADEPTSALDDGNAAALLDLLIESARGHGAALMIATHDRRVLDRVDRVVTLEVLE